MNCSGDVRATRIPVEFKAAPALVTEALRLERHAER